MYLQFLPVGSHRNISYYFASYSWITCTAAWDKETIQEERWTGLSSRVTHTWRRHVLRFFKKNYPEKSKKALANSFSISGQNMLNVARPVHVKYQSGSCTSWHKSRRVRKLPDDYSNNRGIRDITDVEEQSDFMSTRPEVRKQKIQKHVFFFDRWSRGSEPTRI